MFSSQGGPATILSLSRPWQVDLLGTKLVRSPRLDVHTPSSPRPHPPPPPCPPPPLPHLWMMISVIGRCKKVRGNGGSIRYAPYFRYAWIRSAWGLHPKK